MLRSIRIFIGGVLALLGVVLFILPGSIFFLLGGLLLLSYDVPHARIVLKRCQTSLTRAAKRVDKILLHRKLR